MNDLRFVEEAISAGESAAPGGFFLVPLPAASSDQCSAMQRFYQQVYEQAVQANQPSRLRDLFANMN